MGKITFLGVSEESKERQTFSAGGIVFPYGEEIEVHRIPEEIATLPRRDKMKWFKFEGFESPKTLKKEAKKYGDDKRSEF